MIHWNELERSQVPVVCVPFRGAASGAGATQPPARMAAVSASTTARSLPMKYLDSRWPAAMLAVFGTVLFLLHQSRVDLPTWAIVSSAVLGIFLLAALLAADRKKDDAP